MTKPKTENAAAAAGATTANPSPEGGAPPAGGDSPALPATPAAAAAPVEGELLSLRQQLLVLSEESRRREELLGRQETELAAQKLTIENLTKDKAAADAKVVLLEKERDTLQQRLNTGKLASIDLEAGEGQLTSSVTFSSVGESGKAIPARGKVGDLLVLGSFAMAIEVTKRTGRTVYAVNEATLKELVDSKLCLSVPKKK